LWVGVSTAHASSTPTPTPTPPLHGSCVPVPCEGDCAMPAPCTPGTGCPQYLVKGTCEVVSNVCACVTNPLTPVPTPTFGGCGLSCDDRPCVGQCSDGSVVHGFCTSLTVDRGCACAFGCATPTPTPTPFAVCSPPPCKPGEVFYCPANCPGGCGTQCATPTQSPAITPTPTEPCTGVPCGGTCAACPPCTDTVCPGAPCYLGTCEMVSGSCSCVPGIPTPTPPPTPAPFPTLTQCNPSTNECPVGQQCNCCCGTWVCMPPYLPCCALPCLLPTPPATPTPTPIMTCQPIAGLTDCQEDSDCVVVDQSGCCPCRMGGGQAAINHSKQDELSQQLDVCCAAAGVCFDVYQCKDNLAAVCHGGTCTLVNTAGTPIPTPTPTQVALPCVGDCSGDGTVTVDEIVRMVNIALNGDTTPSSCPGSEQWCSSGSVLGAIGITCVIDAVNDALNGCPTPTPTRTPTSTSTARPTPEFGVCYEQVDCTPLPFATHTDREFCCVLAPHGSFSWCSGADIDPVTGLCTHCVYPCAIPTP
jgi:hypothetical protein